MEERLFKRKIYAQLLNWKQESDGKSALLVEGARRVGKSTIVETFAKNAYRLQQGIEGHQGFVQ